MVDGMYLHKLSIRNFRSCYDTNIELQPTITLLVGENNAGKSNVIEALRLVTSPSNGRQTRYFEASDRSVGREEAGIAIAAKYSGLTELQQAQYITALDLGTKRVRYCAKFNVNKDKPRRSRPTYHAGNADASDVEPDKREQIRHVYLAPLRDAQRELDSADGNRLVRVIEALFSDADREAFVEQANRQLAKLSDQDILTKTAKEIQHHLTSLTDPVRRQQVGVNFTEQRLNRLVRSLRLKMAEHDIDLASLAESGLGYANLLYIATVILELDKAGDAELTLFLVEEPEAHLHPQLQVALLDYLMTVAEDSVRDDSLGPAGRIQIVATTHSPNLASGIKVENVVVLRSAGIEVTVADTRPIAGNEDTEVASEYVDKVVKRQQTVAIPIAQLGLAQTSLRKIRQYLDVTKSALLFGRQVVLVEGIAEAVLLPVLARRIVLAGDSERAKELRRKFHATSIVSVGGVDFEPYVRLLLGEVHGHSILDRLVVVTDGDPQLSGMGKKTAIDSSTPAGSEDQDGDDELNGNDEPSTVFVARQSRIEAVADEMNVRQKLRVHASKYTFEADLLIEPENREVLGVCYLAQHTKSKKQWAEVISSSNPGETFYRRLRKNSKLVGKGQFAHDIALAIEDGESFVCPGYLKQAIESAVGSSDE